MTTPSKEKKIKAWAVGAFGTPIDEINGLPPHNPHFANVYMIYPLKEMAMRAVEAFYLEGNEEPVISSVEIIIKQPKKSK